MATYEELSQLAELSKPKRNNIGEAIRAIGFGLKGQPEAYKPLENDQDDTSREILKALVLNKIKQDITADAPQPPEGLWRDPASGRVIKLPTNQTTPDEDIGVQLLKIKEGFGGNIPPGTTARMGNLTIPLAPQQTAETAGKLAMVNQAESDLNEAEKLLFPNGKFDNTMALATNFPGGGFPGSEGRTAYSKILNAVNAKLRIETGAQANPSEVQNILQRFIPTLRDSDSTAKDKYRRLKEFMSNTRAIIDPSGRYQYVSNQSLDNNEIKDNNSDPLGIR